MNKEHPLFIKFFPEKENPSCEWCNDTKAWWISCVDKEGFENQGPCRICTENGREILKRDLGYKSLSRIVKKIYENYNSRV